MSTSWKDLFLSYKKWVSENPLLVADLETTAKWMSYLFTGRIQNSSLVSELVYSMSNLLVLFNDCIINESRRTIPLPSGAPLKTWITVLEYAEVFIEVSAKHFWGDSGKWLVIFMIQIFKCIGRLILLFSHKEHIVQMPPVPPLKRKLIAAQDNQDSTPVTVGFALKSGKIIRCVNGASPTHLRSWKPPQFTSTSPDGNIPDKPLDRDLLIAEVLYIVKPVMHLLSMMRCGPKSWRPYLVSLTMDIASLQVFKSHQKKNSCGKQLSPRQKMELSRREVALLLYLLRSPFYDRYSQKRLQSILLGLANKVPLVGLICRPLAQYIPQWQDTYFYMWST